MSALPNDAAPLAALALSAAAATRRMADLPSPPGLPVLGHLHKLKPTEMHLQLEAWAREYGPAYRISLAGRSVLVLTDSDVAQAVLRDRPQAVRRASMIRPIFAELGIDGLFATEGDAWLPQRKLIMQSLNAQNLRSFFPALQAITERLYRRWERAARSGQVLEMTQELMRYTVDVTSTLSFGEDPHTIDDSGNVIQQHLASIFPMIMRRTLAPLPFWRWLRLPADRSLDRDMAAVHAYAHERIARARRRLLADPGAAPANALEAMILEADRPGSGFDDPLIVANVLTLLLGGEDTTAHGLAWSLLYLAQQPALQQQLHEEALAALGPHTVCPTAETLRALDRFEAVVNEAMRLRPVVAFLGLETRQATVVGGVAVGARQRLFLLSRPAQTDPQRFARPEQFDPQRWLHQGDGAHDARAFLQFGAGPRVCPGRHLAGVEMRLVLAMLMRQFTVELACSPDQVREQLHFTLGPSQMPVRLHLREASAQQAAPPAAAGRCPVAH